MMYENGFLSELETHTRKIPADSTLRWIGIGIGIGKLNFIGRETTTPRCVRWPNAFNGFFGDPIDDVTQCRHEKP